jgi:hypothetical protein
MEINNRQNPKLESDLIQQYASIAHGICARKRLQGDEADHMYQAGLICIFEALDKWDPQKARWVHWVKTYVSFKSMRKYLKDYISTKDSNFLHIVDDDRVADMFDGKNQVKTQYGKTALTEQDVEKLYAPEVHPEIDYTGYTPVQAKIVKLLSEGQFFRDVIEIIKKQFKISAVQIYKEREAIKEILCKKMKQEQ